MTDIFPGEGDMIRAFLKLSTRELCVVGSAVLDAALADILSRRLNGPSGEIEDFLGADGNGRAPAGSFGARIQLALLVGLILEDDFKTLRALKNIRNSFAHNVNACLQDDRISCLLSNIIDIEIKHEINALVNCETRGALESYKSLLTKIKDVVPESEDACRILIINTVASFDYRFRKIYWNINKIPPY